MNNKDEKLSAFHKGQILCEGLILVREDICEWINKLLGAEVVAKESFLKDLGSGIVLCQMLAKMEAAMAEKDAVPKWWSRPVPRADRRAAAGSFKARDNTSKFLDWCRSSGFENTILFETCGLINRDEEKNVVLTLLRLAEACCDIDMPLPQFALFLREMQQQQQPLEPATNKRLHQGRANSVLCVELLSDVDASTDSGLSSARSEANWQEKQIDLTDRCQATVKKNKDRILELMEPPIASKLSPVVQKPEQSSAPARRNLKSLKDPQRKLSAAAATSTRSNTAARNRSASLSNLHNPIDSKVKEVALRCRCGSTSKLIIERSAMQEGMYRLGPKMRFVRLFRGTVVVRVGGGWETLTEHLGKIDPGCFGPGNDHLADMTRSMYEPVNHIDALREPNNQIEVTGDSTNQISAFGDPSSNIGSSSFEFNENSASPSQSNQKAASPRPTNQKTASPSQSNQKAESPRPTNQKAESPRQSTPNLASTRPNNLKSASPRSTNQNVGTNKPLNKNTTSGIHETGASYDKKSKPQQQKSTTMSATASSNQIISKTKTYNQSGVMTKSAQMTTASRPRLSVGGQSASTNKSRSPRLSVGSTNHSAAMSRSVMAQVERGLLNPMTSDHLSVKRKS